MKAVMVMYDSLNRRFLPGYASGGIHLPNFERLAKHTASFDNFYVGSLPCMPARRELHTGRHNFLHRSWGPLEPFDESMPQFLKENGVYTHMITDHAHYWEDGGATYHNRFASYELIRGQEGDPWKAQVSGFTGVDSIRQDGINRHYMQREEDHFHVRACNAALDFIEENHRTDNWFLQLEYFDPHEPYMVPDRFKKLFSDVPIPFDWPQNMPLDAQGAENIGQAALNYMALLTMCDEYLGRILDAFDRYDLWKDTMLIVNTDHGYMLGEKGCVGKNYMPPYQEVVHTPFYLWDPRCPAAGQRRSALAQTIDVAPTILGLFGHAPLPHMQGGDLVGILQSNTSPRPGALFGYHGMHVNVTDGRYVYMRSARDTSNQPLYEYTLMPTRIKSHFLPAELKQADERLFNGFAFSGYTPMLRIPSDERYDKRVYFKCSDHVRYGTLLFDLQNDPEQLCPLNDPPTENRMEALLVECMQANEAPDEQYVRLGLQK